MEEKKRKKESKKTNPSIRFPMNILKPIGDFLSGEARRLEKRKKTLTSEDPFEDTRRVIDNSSPDMEADEQIGHARVTAIREQIERQLIQIRKALARIKIGRYGICEKCGQMIDTDRLMVMPSTTICVGCEKKKEK